MENNKLRDLRLDMGITQEELAKKVRLKRITISRAENGFLTVKTAKRLAEFFKAKWTDFF